MFRFHGIRLAVSVSICAQLVAGNKPEDEKEEKK